MSKNTNRSKLVNRSGQIVAANVAQELAPANPMRAYLYLSPTNGPVWVRFDVAASKDHNSIHLAAREVLDVGEEFDITGAISILGDAVATTFTCFEAQDQ